MKETTITVTEAARNFSDCVNRARYQHVTFVLVKNGRPVARLAPEAERQCTGRELADALRAASLAPREARDWHRDLRAARRTLTTPGDKWQ